MPADSRRRQENIAVVGEYLKQSFAGDEVSESRTIRGCPG